MLAAQDNNVNVCLMLHNKQWGRRGIDLYYTTYYANHNQYGGGGCNFPRKKEKTTLHLRARPVIILATNFLTPYCTPTAAPTKIRTSCPHTGLHNHERLALTAVPMQSLNSVMIRNVFLVKNNTCSILMEPINPFQNPTPTVRLLEHYGISSIGQGGCYDIQRYQGTPSPPKKINIWSLFDLILTKQEQNTAVFFADDTYYTGNCVRNRPHSL